MKVMILPLLCCCAGLFACNQHSGPASDVVAEDTSAYIVDKSLIYYGDIGMMPGLDNKGAGWKGNLPGKNDTLTPVYQIGFTDSSIIYNGMEYSPRKIVIRGKTYYLVEGDQLLDKEEYLLYKARLWAQASPRFPRDKQHKLVMSTRDVEGRIKNKWNNGDTLRYAFNTRDFGSAQRLEMVKRNARKAFDEWEAICNIHFEHLAAYDSKDLYVPEKPLTFVITMLDINDPFVAVSFYPDWAEERRVLFVNSNYFRTGYDKVGVFRHEAGHILGFMHEHIRQGAPPSCPSEVRHNPIPASAPPYDKISVMHYYCGGSGTLGLTFSEQDKKGAAAAYPWIP